MKIWPWSKIAALQDEVQKLTCEIQGERHNHLQTKTAHLATVETLKSNEKDMRKLTTILALKSGLVGLFLMLTWCVQGQALVRNPVTTNQLANAPGLTSFLGWDGTKPVWGIPAGGGSSTNYWTTNGLFLLPVNLLSTYIVSNSLGFDNSGGDISANATNNDKASGIAITNGAINNLSNYVAALGSAITNGGINNLSNYVNALGAAITNGGINNLSNYVNAIASNGTNFALQLQNWTNDPAVGLRPVIATNPPVQGISSVNTTNHTSEIRSISDYGSNALAFASTNGVPTRITNYIISAAGPTPSFTFNAPIYGDAIGMSNFNWIKMTNYMITSLDIPMGAWFTNSVFDGLTITPASAISVTNSGDGFAFADAITNTIRTRFSMPYDYDGGTVEVAIQALCTGTNSGPGGATNVVFAVRAAANGNNHSAQQPTWGTAIWVTNHFGIGAYTNYVAVTTPLTIGNTPSAGISVLWEIQRLGAQAGDTETNVNMCVTDVKVFYNRVPVITYPTPTP